MDWLNSASTIASLVLAVFGIGGYLYGIVTYLRTKASPKQQTTTPAQTSIASKAKPSVRYIPISWIEWTEIFAQGLVDTADFVLTLAQFPDLEKQPIIGRLGGCALLCGVVVFFGEFFFGLILSGFLSVLGLKNPLGAAIVIDTILFFMTFSLVYIYHVGLLVEKRQREMFRKMRMKMQQQRSTGDGTKSEVRLDNNPTI